MSGMIGLRFLCLMPWLLLAMGDLAAAQTTIGPLSPRFSPDPQVYVGSVSGDAPLAAIAGDGKNCSGIGKRKPTYTLQLRESFGFLRLVVSGERMALVVKGPDGIYCRYGDNPEVSGTWAGGTYQIWVGTMDGSNRSYRLQVSETGR